MALIIFFCTQFFNKFQLIKYAIQISINKQFNKKHFERHALLMLIIDTFFL